MPRSSRLILALALCCALLPTLAQPTADKPTAEQLRAQLDTLSWLAALDLSSTEATTWLEAIEGAPALLAAIDAQENAPAVLAALEALRQRLLAGQLLTDEDWTEVDEARCQVAAARDLDEPDGRRQQALLPITTKLVVELTHPQQIALVDDVAVEMTERVLRLIAQNQRVADGERWRQGAEQIMAWARQEFAAQGDVRIQAVKGLLDAGRAMKLDDFAQGRAALRDDLLVACCCADHTEQKLPREAALNLAKAILTRPQLPAALKLWAARTP